MFVRKLVRTVCGVVLLGVLATPSTSAIPNAHRTTHFTFPTAVALPGVTLPAGSYVFEVLNPDSSADLVRVLNRERTRTYTLQFTRFIHRPASQSMKPTITLGEAPGGTPRPIRTWFPEADTLGREFLYY